MSPAARRRGEQLGAEADAEDGPAAFELPPDEFDLLGQVRVRGNFVGGHRPT